MKARIGLLTDFGTKAGYVASVKGTILSICDDCTIIDLSHDISPQNVMEAAYFLDNCALFFPSNFIFLVVVDPGVGTDRKMLCVKTRKKEQIFIAPDNGVLELVINEQGVEAIVSLENKRYWRGVTSLTFHGRDIMGPVAAHIASGVPVTRLGPPLELDGIARLELPSPARVDESGAIVGSVLYTDQFGNIITNINEEAFGHLQVNVSTRFSIVVNSNTPSGCFKEARFTQVYADVPEKEALCLFNSENRFEIAINKGSAAAFFGNPAPRNTVLVRKIG